MDEHLVVPGVLAHHLVDGPQLRARRAVQLNKHRQAPFVLTQALRFGQHLDVVDDQLHFAVLVAVIGPGKSLQNHRPVRDQGILQTLQRPWEHHKLNRPGEVLQHPARHLPFLGHVGADAGHRPGNGDLHFPFQLTDTGHGELALGPNQPFVAAQGVVRDVDPHHVLLHAQDLFAGGLAAGREMRRPVEFHLLIAAKERILRLLALANLLVRPHQSSVEIVEDGVAAIVQRIQGAGPGQGFQGTPVQPVRPQPQAEIVKVGELALFALLDNGVH